MKQKLLDYGFPECMIDDILSGKVVNVPYGKVKYYKKSGTLITYYSDGRSKTEEL